MSNLFNWYRIDIVFDLSLIGPHQKELLRSLRILKLKKFKKKPLFKLNLLEFENSKKLYKVVNINKAPVNYGKHKNSLINRRTFFKLEVYLQKASHFSITKIYQLFGFLPVEYFEVFSKILYV